MTNNEIFKTFLHLTGLTHNKALIEEIFKLGGITVSRSKIKGWRTDIENPRASHMSDDVLRGFFKGLFIYRDDQSILSINLFNFPKCRPDSE